MDPATGQAALMGRELEAEQDDIAPLNEDSLFVSESESLLRRLARSIAENPALSLDGTSQNVHRARYSHQDEDEDEDGNEDGEEEEESEADEDDVEDAEEEVVDNNKTRGEEEEDEDMGEDDEDEEGNGDQDDRQSAVRDQNPPKASRNEANKSAKRCLLSESRYPSPVPQAPLPPQSSSERVSPEAKSQPTPPKSVRRGRRTKKEILAMAPPRRRSSRIENQIEETATKPTANGIAKSTPKPDQKKRRGRPAKEDSEPRKTLHQEEKIEKRGRPAKANPEPRKISKQEWEIEKIVGSRIDADTHEHFYEVKWKGYSTKENTWEPKLNLGKCRAAIADFEKRSTQK